MLEFGGRVILVTGGSRGIGRAVALDLGRHGAKVIVHFHTGHAAANEVVSKLASSGAEACAIQADVREPDEIRSLVAEAAAWGGSLSGLVTCAGIYEGGETPAMSRSEWDEVLRTDLDGTFWTVLAAHPCLLQTPRSSVVTISSILGSHPAVGGVPYQAAKAAIEQMTRSLALEFAPKIRVNSVAPGFIRTDLNQGAHSDPEFGPLVARRTPLGRWGEPEDIAGTVRFLLSDRAAWITGAVLGVDGGLALR